VVVLAMTSLGNNKRMIIIAGPNGAGKSRKKCAWTGNFS